MKKFFKELDLYKGIVLVSWLLLPVVGGWAYWLQGELKRADTALHDAMRTGGDLEEIGKYQKAVEEQRRNSASRTEVVDNPRVYFDKCIRVADQSGNLKRTDYEINPKGTTNGGKNAQDTIVDIDFKDMALNRDFLMAVLFNCEASSPVWKLRALSIRNADMKNHGYGRRKEPPPPELSDKWEIQKLEFASRAPRPEGR